MREVFLTNRGSSDPICRGQSDAHPHVQVNLRHDTRECPCSVTIVSEGHLQRLEQKVYPPETAGACGLCECQVIFSSPLQLTTSHR